MIQGSWNVLSGMTGSVAIEGKRIAKYRTFVVDDAHWPPRFWKLQLDFDGEDHLKLALTDSRRFARIRLQARRWALLRTAVKQRGCT
jgi:Formamidopyrimidine-DNA glycosylase N-terminal domain